MDMQRDTYCPIAMARAEGGEADLFGVVDAALRVTEANGLPNHADRHAGDGEDPIISLGAHDLTGNMTLDANVDILADDDYSNDLGSEPSPFLDIYGNYLRLHGRFGVGLPTVGTRYYRGTYAAPTNVLNNDVLFQLRMYGRHGGLGGWDEGGRIELLATQAWTSGGDSGACMKFWVIDQNDGNPSEYLRLDGNGETIRAYRDIQLANGEDLLCATAFGSDLFSAATPGGNAYLGRDVQLMSDDQDCRLLFQRFNGTWAAKTKVLAGDFLGNIHGYGYHGAGWGEGARIGFYARENWAAGAYGCAMAFYVTDVGDAVPDTYMRLDGAGETIDLLKTVDAQADIRMAAGMDVDCYTYGGYLKPRRVSQAARPVPDTGELLVWRDTDDDKTYLVYEDPDVGTRQVEMT